MELISYIHLTLKLFQLLLVLSNQSASFLTFLTKLESTLLAAPETTEEKDEEEATASIAAAIGTSMDAAVASVCINRKPKNSTRRLSMVEKMFSLYP